MLASGLMARMTSIMRSPETAPASGSRRHSVSKASMPYFSRAFMITRAISALPESARQRGSMAAGSLR
ncbi:hypothetical protein D3C72_2217030 [compost metagenome]